MKRHLVVSSLLVILMQAGSVAQNSVPVEDPDKKTKTGTTQGEPKGWFLSGESPTFYEIGLDTSNPHSGKACALLQSTKQTKSHMWATLMQEMGPQEYFNKRLRINFWVKTETPNGRAQPWMRVDGQNTETVSFDNMCTRSITGLTDWKQYSIVLDVPEKSTNIAFGIMLMGSGKIFYDDVSFDIVGKDVTITDCPCSSNYKGKKLPANLSFEEGLKKP